MKNTRKLTLFIVIVLLSAVVLSGCLGSFILETTLPPLTGRVDGNDDNNSGGNNSGNYNTGIKDSVVDLYKESTPPPASSVSDMLESIHPSVVEINATLADGTSAGSGVFIGKGENNSYILTCQHVVEDATKLTVILTDKTEHNAYYVGGLPDQDIAVIKINKVSGITFAEYRDLAEYPLRVGEDVYAIGNPLGSLGGSVTKGIISSAVPRDIYIEGTTLPLIQTDASINKGNSGGGLFDSNGTLVGIVNAKSVGDTVEGLGFAIPIDNAINMAKDFIDTSNEPNNQYGGLGYVRGKFMIGITISYGELPSGVAYGDITHGYQIQEIDLHGSAAGALKKGDYIVLINDKKITDISTLKGILSASEMGNTVSFTVRDQQVNTVVDVVLKQYVFGYIYNT
ncbi:MAG: trypsin-like peptidase domain-containing protein [Clostridia bacterium]